MRSVLLRLGGIKVHQLQVAAQKDLWKDINTSLDIIEKYRFFMENRGPEDADLSIQNPYFWSINRNNLGFINLLDSWILRKFWADSNLKHDIYPPNVSKRHLGGKLFWNRKVASDRICHHHSRDDPSILTFSDTPLDWGYLGMLQGHVGVLLDSTFAYIWTIFGNHRR